MKLSKFEQELYDFAESKDMKPVFEESFEDADGNLVQSFEDKFEEGLIPVFINEAAYLEKGIAMSLTVRESWQFEKQWSEDLKKILIK